ncbi:AIPR family protein [Bacteroides ihuae]|uniref:AIPR family protein n=1 Tax=Bacteroides ihuae TaxID=1852362 RepID=UPI0008D8EC3F|nr:AIPR family protein [Bacteroides ihuae]
MIKYNFLIKILDQIRKEGWSNYSKKYAKNETDNEKINQARARAFIHLYFKVSFGLTSFEEREHFITDGSYDGGIDGYYIHSESKTIFFIQSKFRTTRENFETKEIELEEILVMDINRILEGEDQDEQGNEYNGKIKQLQREISQVEDIARYKYHVVLLANLTIDLTPSKMRYLTGGYPMDIIDHKKCYDKLVFPVITGTYFNATDLNINIDLSNKNAGSKISYKVQTKNGDCEITVLFVPTLEIARILSKYKNSILKYNPRSYLEFEGQIVNNAIRETIMHETTNEFALFNNGITMLSDDTDINEKVGQKNRAQLVVKNPQIINGGQTAFTLSKILEENINKDYEQIFSGKEVLLKVITLLENGDSTESKTQKKLQLIDDVSTATNQQTAVITADRYSNEIYHVKLQKIIFNNYGILYERKRGEFADGISQGYLSPNTILERNLFFRILFASEGKINKAAERKLFQEHDLSGDIHSDNKKLDDFYFSFLCFQKIQEGNPNINRKDRNIYGQIYLMTKIYKPDNIESYKEAIDSKFEDFKTEWNKFVEETSSQSKRYNKVYIDKETNLPRSTFNVGKWYRSLDFEKDLMKYFK